MRLLLVEDYLPLANALEEALTRAGFAVDHASSVQMAKTLGKAADYDLVILDLGLPDGDGLSLLPILRQEGRIPVMVLTARDQLDDRLAGLDGGADDYIIKPIEMPELVARCRAVLRRPGERAHPELNAGPLILDTRTRAVSIGGRPLKLGQREVSVLEALMRAFGRVLPRYALEEAVYNFDQEITPNALEASVSRLRKAIKKQTSDISIVTVRGVGWMLTEEAES